jgi:ferredoxin
MCEFCTRHGEGKKWYENISNYTEEMFHRVNSDRNLRAFAGGLYRALKVDVQRAGKWKKRLPRIYDLIVYPLVTMHLKKSHFGQIVPIEDIENVLDKFSTVVRLPCICRKVTTGINRRYCLGVGADLTHIFRDVPELEDFDRISVSEAKELVRGLDIEGNAHSVWTLNTPYIGMICNCNRDCMAYRFQHEMRLGKAMFKAEYTAVIDPLLCTGCRDCVQRCYFDAIIYDRRNSKCSADPLKCYGCGLCRRACASDAIAMHERAAPGVW